MFCGELDVLFDYNSSFSSSVNEDSVPWPRALQGPGFWGAVLAPLVASEVLSLPHWSGHCYINNRFFAPLTQLWVQYIWIYLDISGYNILNIVYKY